MQTLKIVALGTLFSVVGSVGYFLVGVLIGITRGPIETNHATGLSAVLGGLLEATVFNPFYWLGIVLAFGLAFWITGKSRKSHTA
jgi:uncharacterized membrane protein YdfJ with MMPL/SSD domain